MKRLGYLLAVGLILTGARPACADAVTDWNELMQATVTRPPAAPPPAVTSPTNPNLQTRWGAIVQLAVFEAVNAITGDYAPYLGTIAAPPGASPAAAAIAAAHHALFGVRPDAAAALNLNTRRAESLAAIPDGPAKDAGIAVGVAAATAMLQLRAGDGWNIPVPYAQPADPGVWQPLGMPPSVQVPVVPGWGQLPPFGLADGSQFRLPPPPGLKTGKYARDYQEVKLLGRAGPNPFRPLDRENVARFYAAASPVAIWNSAARQVSAAQGKTLSENARILALLAMAMADASIAGWDTKYTYNLWRPQGAIRGGDLDGNAHTEADATWLPLIPTPAHPTYASGHATVSGAARLVVERAFGKHGHAVTLTHPAVPGVVLNYTAWKQVCADIDDARIYGGIHFRFDQEAGARQGRQVGQYLLEQWLRAPGEDVAFGGDD